MRNERGYSVGFRNTALVEELVRGGYTEREAEVFERWLDDRRPAGKGPIHLCVAIQRARAREINEKDQEIAVLLEKIDAMEVEAYLFGMPSTKMPS